MQWRQYSAVAVFLALPWQFSAHAADQNSEQFLSDISSINLPQDTSPQVAEKKNQQKSGSTSSPKSTDRHSSPSASEKALRNDIRLLKKKNAALVAALKSQKAMSGSSPASDTPKSTDLQSQQQINALQQQLKTQLEANASDKKKIAELMARSNNAVEQSESQKAEVAKYQQQIAELQKKLKVQEDAHNTDKKTIAELTTSNTNATGSNAGLKATSAKYQQQIINLQNDLKTLQNTTQKKITELTAMNTAAKKQSTNLATENSKYQQQIKELQEALKKSQDSGAENTAILTKKLDELTTMEAAEAEKNTALKAESEKSQQQISKLQEKLKQTRDSGSAEIVILQKKVDQLTAQETARVKKNTTLEAESQKYQQQIIGLQNSLKTLQDVSEKNKSTQQKKIDELAAINTAVNGQNAAMKAEGEKYKKMISDLQMQLQTRQDTSTADKKIITDLNAQKKAITEQNNALKAENNKIRTELASAPKEKVANTGKKKPETLLQQESYTAGVIFSSEMKNRIAKNKELGIDIDPDLMLEGINDGYGGKSQLDDSKLKSISNNMDLKISSALNKKKKAIYDKLDKAVAGKKVISQSGGVSIVLEKKGKTPYKKDSTVVFDSSEKTLSGKTIVNSYNNKIEDQSKLPPMLMQAIKEARKGGHITFYGLAGNVYTPERLPKDISADTPVRIDFVLK